MSVGANDQDRYASVYATIEQSVLAREDPDLLEAWQEAKAKDIREGSGFARLALWDKVRFGQWAIEQRRRPPRGTRRALRDRVGPDAYDIGRWVRAERVLAVRTQAQLADATGLTRIALSRIERGVRDLTFAEACAIAAVLDISVEAFRPPS